MIKTILCAVGVLLASATVAAEDEQAKLPFSKALRVGNMLYLSGELGAKPGTMSLVPGGIGPETRQTMDNIKATLEAHGSDMDHVVKCLVMMADISEWAAMNEVYRTYFDDRFPARSAMGANGLALGARVEIECMATVKE
ncbi:RidA family protein [Kordiimonas aestuarii]|uniref:RidA family protein n=1 Tax=Kordiimonas aestuarii TaxID=1005925 RepID=UPI00374D3382